MTTDAELWVRYSQEKSEAAFAELVQRHVAMVYSAALRQVGGDTHLAQEVTQDVFTALARKAHQLSGRETIAGWLYLGTHRAARVAAATTGREAREGHVGNRENGSSRPQRIGAARRRLVLGCDRARSGFLSIGLSATEPPRGITWRRARYRGAHQIYVTHREAILSRLRNPDPGQELAIEFMERQGLKIGETVFRRQWHRVAARLRHAWTATQQRWRETQQLGRQDT